MIIAGLLLLAAVPEPAPDASATASADIVVRARRGRCEIIYAGSKLDGRALETLADGWPAGRPLHVQEPRGGDRKCLVHVTLELADRGFKTVQFVEPLHSGD
jgi:hypothetical protein